jgi:2-isopropylmalate synthase
MDEPILTIFDTTLRDGEQTPGVTFDVARKVEIAKALADLGVDVIEAGYPASSASDFAAVEEVSRQVGEVTICAFARALPRDIEMAAQATRQARKRRVQIVVPVSDRHIERRLASTRKEMLSRIRDAIGLARQTSWEVSIIAEDASRSDLQFLCDVVETATIAGASTVAIADTVGCATPADIESIFTTIGQTRGANATTLAIHCHDDLGLATANTLTAVRYGAREVHACINGIGERAGNAALEEIAAVLTFRRDSYPFRHGINLQGISRTSRLVEEASGIALPPNKAVVGGYAFTHESGLHQDGIAKDPSTYEAFAPHHVGAERSIAIGRHSGRAGLRLRLSELGIAVPDDCLPRMLDHIKAGSGTLNDSALRRLVDQVLAAPGR